MRFPMPLIPPLKPNTGITPIVLIINTETTVTSSKVFLGPLHHVLLVLGPLVVQEGDGGEGGWSRLSYNALQGVLTAAATLYIRFIKGNIIPGMEALGRGALHVGGGGGGQRAGQGGRTEQALATCS